MKIFAAKDLILLLPLVSLVVFSLIPLVVKVLNKNKEPSSVLVFSMYFLGILNSLILFLLLGFQGNTSFGLVFDTFNTGSACLIALSGLQALPLFFFNKVINKKSLTEILFLFSGVLLFLYVFCLAGDFILAFIGLESASLLTYILIAMSKEYKPSLQAAMKYFILSSFAACIFLYGISFIFGISGQVDFLSLKSANSLYFDRFFFLGLGLVLSGLLFKIGIFPFQFWLPDVYQGAPTPVTTYMATSFKVAVVLFLAKIFTLPLFSVGPHGEFFIQGLSFLSVITLLFASLQALKQNKIKGLMAYSSMAHSAYLMMALSQILQVGSVDMRVIGYYLLGYVFMQGGFLTVIQILESKTPEPSFRDIDGLFKKEPFLAAAFSICLLGLAGLPPAFGFFSKLKLIEPLIISQNYWLITWMILGSAVGLYYYMRPLTLMAKNPGEKLVNFSAGYLKFLLGLSSIITLFGALFFARFFVD